jgi:hypothetical protein
VHRTHTVIHRKEHNVPQEISYKNNYKSIAETVCPARQDVAFSAWAVKPMNAPMTDCPQCRLQGLAHPHVPDICRQCHFDNRCHAFRERLVLLRELCRLFDQMKGSGPSPEPGPEPDQGPRASDMITRLCGEVRQFTESESPDECHRCHRMFVRRIFPVVALICGHFYHRECLAQLMSSGETRCHCGRPLFQISP